MTIETVEQTTRGSARLARARGPLENAAVAESRASLRAENAARGGRVREGILTALAVLGVVAVAWVVTSWIFGLTVIVFVTGSMSPGLPTGSAAIVQTVPASRLAPGDIVTVPKQGNGNPVTHRVIAIDPVPQNEAARSLTLKGDANSIPDPGKYVVTEAKRVVVGMPYAGWVVIAMKSPIAMIVLSILLAAAIAWALWPSGRRRRRSSSSST